ncbi:hypothetical protein X564_00975 [Pseudoalteromonas agarivorans]|nr:hypothetical protein X564_00975 [Pseudoalteromonas agarivorans]
MGVQIIRGLIQLSPLLKRCVLANARHKKTATSAVFILLC